MGVWDRRIKHKNGTVTVMRYITWYEPGTGKSTTKSLGPASQITKTEAKALLADENNKLKKKKSRYKHFIVDPLFSDFMDNYILYARDVQKKRLWKRDVSSLRNLSESFGKKYLSDITTHDINLYREKRLKDGKTPRTINLELSCLSRLFKVAKEHERFVGENPVSSIKPFEIHQSSDRILTAKEEVRLLQASPPHLERIIVCALNTGMRQVK